MIYLQLFYTFFKIGLFGFGGGYAMLSMIQGEVVTRYDWVSTQEFTDIVAISQSTPGPIGINAATYVGFTATGSVWGSVIATFAVVLPSFILMLTISKFFSEIPKTSCRRSCFQRTPTCRSRTAGVGSTGLDEYGEFRFTDRGYLYICNQHYHLLSGLYRNEKVQCQPDSDDYCLRNSRTDIILGED